MKEAYKELVKSALNVKKNSYSPYSNFRVGAAILTAGGEIFTGTNMENSSYGLSVCAERAAVLNAVSHGERKFTAIAISSSGKKPCFPCGACLQVLSEFAKDMDIIIDGKKPVVTRLSRLLPKSFKLKK